MAWGKHRKPGEDLGEQRRAIGDCRWIRGDARWWQGGSDMQDTTHIGKKPGFSSAAALMTACSALYFVSAKEMV